MITIYGWGEEREERKKLTVKTDHEKIGEARMKRNNKKEYKGWVNYRQYKNGAEKWKGRR